MLEERPDEADVEAGIDKHFGPGQALYRNLERVDGPSMLLSRPISSEV
jgi:hypothetical protein